MDQPRVVCVPLGPPVGEAPLVAALVEAVERGQSLSLLGRLSQPLMHLAVEPAEAFGIGDELVEVKDALLPFHRLQEPLYLLFRSGYVEIALTPIRHIPSMSGPRLSRGPLLFIHQARSVFIGQKQRRHRAVRLGDDPVFGAPCGGEAREETTASAKRAVVRLAVLAAYVAPVAPRVQVEGRGDIDIAQGRKSPRRRDHLTEVKERFDSRLRSLLLEDLESAVLPGL